MQYERKLEQISDSMELIGSAAYKTKLDTNMWD